MIERVCTWQINSINITLWLINDLSTWVDSIVDSILRVFIFCETKKSFYKFIYDFFPKIVIVGISIASLRDQVHKNLPDLSKIVSWIKFYQGYSINCFLSIYNNSNIFFYKKKILLEDYYLYFICLIFVIYSYNIG